MAFKFRLEKVLNYRNRIVELISQEVAEAKRKVKEVEEQIQTLEKEIDFHNNPANRLQGQIHIQLMLAQTNWLSHLKNVRQDLQHNLESAEQELSEVLLRLTNAFQDVEILEKLKEKKKQEWRDEQEKRERKVLDEIGQIRADRRSREMTTG